MDGLKPLSTLRHQGPEEQEVPLPDLPNHPQGAGQGDSQDMAVLHPAEVIPADREGPVQARLDRGTWPGLPGEGHEEEPGELRGPRTNPAEVRSGCIQVLGRLRSWAG